MIDVNEMRRKFPAKDAGKARRKNAAIKQIARDYEMKKAELNGLKAPALKKGPVFYVVMLLGLMLLASLIMSVTGKGGRAPISRAHVNARKSLKALALALGRYRYHTGSYPASLDDLASTRIVKAGWNGPYVKQIVDDPWGQPYVYVPDASGGAPTLYSRGPDKRGGTTDDIMVDASLFDEPFRDTSWTKDWMPYQLRGIVVAPDEATRQAVRAQVTNCLAATSRADAEARARHAAFLEKTVSLAELEEAVRRITTPPPRPVQILTAWTREDEDPPPVVEVACAVEGDAAELFVNGVSAGKAPVLEGRATWSVTYEPGEIKVIGYRDTHPFGEDAVSTAAAPVAVRLKLLASTLGDDEIGYAWADLVDDAGTPYPGKEDEAVVFSLAGPGEIVLTAPRAVAFRRTQGSGGALQLTAQRTGLRPASTSIPWRSR